MRLTLKVLESCLVIVGVLALVAAPVAPAYGTPAAAIRYVSPAGVTSGTCSTWATACDLQYALTTAASGDELWVKAGTYKPTPGTDRHATFQLKNGVAVYGGFAGTETARNQRNWTTNVTILSGDINTSGNSADNVYHVVSADTVDPTGVLDGFTITDGNADDNTAACPSDGCGGGLYITGGAPSLTNLILADNAAIDHGGGLYLANAADGPTFEQVTFLQNKAYYGGGLFIYNSTATFTDTVFDRNSVINDGGGLNSADSTFTMTKAIFTGNSAVSYGGAMNNANSYPALTDVTFEANSVTDGSGGAMLNDYSSPTLERVTFSNNTVVGGNGGAMYNDLLSAPVLTNVTFYSNSARMSGGFNGGYGGAIFDYVNDNPPRFLNVTFNANRAIGYDVGHRSYGGAVYLSGGAAIFTNTILWGNTPDQVYDDGSTTTFNTGVVQGGCPTGLSCSGTIITTNPRLGPLGNFGGEVKTLPLMEGSSAIGYSERRGLPRHRCTRRSPPDRSTLRHWRV